MPQRRHGGMHLFVLMVTFQTETEITVMHIPVQKVKRVLKLALFKHFAVQIIGEKLANIVPHVQTEQHMLMQAQLDKSSQMVDSQKMTGKNQGLQFIPTQTSHIVFIQPEIKIENPIATHIFRIDIRTLGGQSAQIFHIQTKVLNQA